MWESFQAIAVILVMFASLLAFFAVAFTVTNEW